MHQQHIATTLSKPAVTTSGTVILVDTSGSMAHLVGTQRRIDVMKGVLRHVQSEIGSARVVAFGSLPVECHDGGDLPEPCGSTALHTAIEFVARSLPSKLVIISDGEPDDRRAAMLAVSALPGAVISTWYCGEEGNRAAISFLRDLALAGKGGPGRALVRDLRNPRQIASEVKGLLT